MSLFKEYLDDPEATARSFDEDGWFHTGDLVQLSEQGYRDLFAEYTAGGGAGPRIVQRWVFLGDPPQAEIDQLNRGYQDVPGDHKWWDSNSAIIPVSGHDPVRMADQLAAWMEASGGTVLSIRFHFGSLRGEIVNVSRS